MLVEARKKHSGVIVSFSGGKDSMAVLDLCSKAGFEQIVCVHLYFVPGLQVVQQQLDYARKRYQVEILEYVSPSVVDYLAAGDYNDMPTWLESMQSWTHEDIVGMVREDTGLSFFATGHKRSAAIGQGLSNAVWANKHPDEIQPLVEWNKHHVVAYLSANKIPMPPSDGRNSSSMDLHPRNLLWLWNEHREDFKRLQKVFPYIEAVVRRKEWFGVPKD